MKTQRMSGKVLQKAIIDLAHLHGWRVAHFASVLAIGRDKRPVYRTPVMADGKGFPDLFMVRGPQAMAIEVKGDGDTLRPEQQEWLNGLEDAGIHVDVWSPREWRSGVVEDALR